MCYKHSSPHPSLKQPCELFGETSFVTSPAAPEADARKVEVLRRLGLSTAPSTGVLHACGRHLEQLAGGQIDKRVQEMSHHLVEALCRAISLELSQPSQPSLMAPLVEIAKRRILLVRTLCPDADIRQQCQLLLDQSQMAFRQEAALELGSFDGAAFATAQASWDKKYHLDLVL